MKKIILIILLSYGATVFAHAGGSASAVAHVGVCAPALAGVPAPCRDSLLPVNAGLPLRVAWNAGSREEVLNTELVEIELGYHNSGDHRKAFARLLRMARQDLHLGYFYME